MTDIMHDFKKNRFIVTPHYISNGLPEPVYGHLVVLSDVGYWAANVDDLIVWCGETGCKLQGMTIDVPTDELLTLFCLRWSG